jgi:hypothetical protein
LPRRHLRELPDGSGHGGLQSCQSWLIGRARAFQSRSLHLLFDAIGPTLAKAILDAIAGSYTAFKVFAEDSYKSTLD